MNPENLKIIKKRFEKDFKHYKANLEKKLNKDEVNLMLHAYCMGYCEMVNYVSEDVGSMYLVDPVLEKISELSPLIKHKFE